MELKLRILYSDTKESRWYQAISCAITKALARAGRDEWKHTGLHIREGNKIIVDEGCPGLIDLSRRVSNMYYPQDLRKRTIKDFTFTLRW